MGKWVIGIWMLYILGSLISGVCEMQYLSGSGSGMANAVFVQMFDVPALREVNLFSVIGVVVEVGVNWIQGLINILLWNYAFFDGGAAIFKWVLLYPLSIGLITMTIFSLRGSSS